MAPQFRDVHGLPSTRPTSVGAAAPNTRTRDCPDERARIMAPPQSTRGAKGVGVASVAGPGCGLSEEPAVGVGPVTLDCRVVAVCPPDLDRSRLGEVDRRFG